MLKYRIIGDGSNRTAVLQTRELQAIGDANLEVQFDGIPAEATGASLTINPYQRDVDLGCMKSYAIKDKQVFNAEKKSFEIINGTATIPNESLMLSNYGVIVAYTVGGVKTEVVGNPFKIFIDAGSRVKSVLPAPLSTATDLEKMWMAINAIIDEVGKTATQVDTLQNGNEII